MKYFLLLQMPLLFGLPPLVADEFAIVVTDSGSLRNANGDIVDTIPFFSVVPIKAEDGEDLIVEHASEDRRLRKAYAHRSSQLGYVTTDNEDVILETFRIIERAARASDKGDYDGSTKLTAQALEYLESETSQALVLHPWILQYEASLHYAAGNYDTADRVLNRCNQLAEQLAEPKHLHTANILNTQGLVKFAQGDTAAAIALYQKALAIVVLECGKSHHDYAAVNTNLGHALARGGQHKKAIAALEQAAGVYTETEGEDSQQAQSAWKLVERLVSEVSLDLVNTGQQDDAADMVIDLLNRRSQPSREYHLTLIAVLAKAYVLQGDLDDGQKLLTTIMMVAKTEKNGASVDSIAGLIAFTELAKLDIAAQEWEAGALKLKRAVVIHERLQSSETLSAAEVHGLLGTVHRKLEAFDLAKTHFERTLAICKKLDDAENPLARTAAAELREMMPEPVTPAKLVGLDAFDVTQLIPDTEQMLVATEERKVFGADSDNANEVIATVPADTMLWSLEFRDGRHRVYLDEQKRFGWIAEKDVTSQHERLTAEEMVKLFERMKYLRTRESRIEEIRIAYKEARGDDLNAPKFHTSRPSEDPAEGIAAIQKTLRLIKRYREQTEYLNGLLYLDLAELYIEAGQPLQASEAADESLGFLLSTVGYRHPLTALARRYLAMQERRIGESYRERSELKEILEAVEKHFGPKDLRVQMQQLNLAASLVRLGSFENAAQIYIEIITSQGRDSTPTTLPLAIAHQATGTLLAKEGRSVQAATYLERAVANFTELGDPFPALRAEAILQLATVLADQGEYPKALEILEDAEKLELNPFTAGLKFAVLIQKSRISAQLNNAPAAMSFASTAFVLAGINFGHGSFIQHDARQALGRAHTKQNLPLAANAFQEARKLAFRYIHQTLAYQSFRHQSSFLATDKRSLDEALSIAFVEGAESVVEATATWLINSHNLLPELAATEGRLISLCTDRSELNKLNEWRPLRESRAKLPLPFMSVDERRLLQIDVVQQQQQAEETGVFQELHDVLREEIERDRPWITCADLRDKLKSDEVLIVIRKFSAGTGPSQGLPKGEHGEFQSEPYAVWLIPAKGAAEVDAFILGEAQQIDSLGVARTMETTDAIVRDLRRRGERRSAELQRAEFQKLADLLWKPIARRLPSTTTRIAFCVDGDLHRVPWIALPSSKNRTVFDDYAVRHLSSPRDLFRKPIVIETNPPTVFSASSDIYKDASVSAAFPDRVQFFGTRSAVRQPDYIRSKLAEVIQEQRLPRIGNTELQDVARRLGVYGDTTVRPYVASKASEFRYQATLRPQTLHFAVNSIVLQRDDVPLSDPFPPSQSRILIPSDGVPRFHPFERCGLLLTGYANTEAQPTIFDGILTGEEVITQDLRGTELVVTSHCPVPLEGQSPEDGLTLLPQIFLLAGAESVVSPIWELDEESISAFMKSFYFHLAGGKSPSESLRNAQREIRDARVRKYGAAHPFYWAGFRLTGAE